VSAWKYLWLFEIGRMRNSHLKDIRAEWKGRVSRTRYYYPLLNHARSTVYRTGRLFFGRVSVMALALGTTPESEFMPGLNKFSEVSTHIRLFIFGLLETSKTPSMSSACKGKLGFSSLHGPHQKPLSGLNRFLGQNSREWARSPLSTLPFLRGQ